MSISRPFAYNTASITTGVSASFGNLSIGFISQSYNINSGLKWYNGPDESSGYVIGTSLPSGGPTSPDGTTGNVQFWRTSAFLNSELISLTNKITGQNFSDFTSAQTWLNSNGYFISQNPNPSSLDILVGGFFISSSLPTPRSRLAKLNDDFSVNASFNSGSGLVDGFVNVFATQSDGKILVGGGFTSYNGTSINRLMRLNNDSTLDTTFNIGTGFNDTVYSLQIQPNDGKILVGGVFTLFNGVSVSRLIRLNNDGSRDTTFNTGTGFPAGTNIQRLAIQSDGKIIAAGLFTSYQGTTRNNIVRLTNSGSYDNDFNIGTGFNSFINALVIQPDGKIIATGPFTTYQGVTRNRIVRLTNSGSYDNDFNIGTGLDLAGLDIDLQSDGKILIGGYFTSYNGSSSNQAIRLTNSGSYDSTFNIGATGFNFEVIAIVARSDGKIIAGGRFTSYKGTSCDYIISLNSDGTIDSTLPQFKPSSNVSTLFKL